MHSNPKKSGFTLVELLIAISIFSVLMAGVLWFWMQNVKGINASEQRMKLAAQVKKFTNELILQGSRSNQFILFKSVTPADFDGSPAAPAVNVDRQTIPSSGTLLHPAGDFVVFVYYEIPKPAAQARHRITKLEGYYLGSGVGTTGPLKKVLIDLSAAPSTNSVEAILTANWNSATSSWNAATTRVSTYFNYVRGLALPEIIDGTAVVGTPSARLFYMSDARNILISGQVFSSQSFSSTYTGTNAFNFTITPRT